MAQPNASLSRTSIYARAPDVVPRRIAGETILVPIRGEMARLQALFVLNAVGEEIWNLLDGRRTVADVCAEIARTFEADEATVFEDLEEFLADLAESGLVTKPPHGV